MLAFVVLITCALITIAVLACRLMSANEKIFRMEVEKVELEAESGRMLQIIDDLRGSIVRLNNLAETRMGWKRTGAIDLVASGKIKSVQLAPITPLPGSPAWSQLPTVHTQAL